MNGYWRNANAKENSEESLPDSRFSHDTFVLKSQFPKFNENQPDTRIPFPEKISSG